MKTTHPFRYLGGSLLIAALFSIAFIKPDSFDAADAPLPALAAVDNVVKDEMARQDLVGIVVGVVQNGNITHVKAYGHLDEERTKAMTTATVMRWASISKMVTSVAAFKAIEMGKLALNDKATKYVSYWSTDGNKKDITLSQLLSHRSGIVHYGKDEDEIKICNYNQSAYNAHNDFNAEQSVKVFKNCDLAFTPGSKYRYTTFGFNLAGAIVEEATNKPYETFVKENISNKAGMPSMTGYSSDPGGIGKDCNTFLNKDTEGDVEWKLPGGGWASNITDMTNFLKGMCNGIYLSNMSALWQPVAGNGSYCYGVTKETSGGKTHISHGGAHDDVRTYLGYFPNDKTGVCVMINNGDWADAERVGKLIENALGYSWNINNLPKDYCGSDNSCGQNMVGVWRNTGKASEVLIRRGFKTDEFHKEWETLLAAGFYPDDIETWVDGTVRKWDGIFKKTTKRSAMIRNYSTDDFHNKWVELTNQGLRLIDVETYLDGTVRKWAGTFIESTEGYALYREMSSDDMHNKYVEMNNKNMKLIDIETYFSGTVQKWAAVWKGSGTVLLNRDYKENDFVNLRNEREKLGYKLTDVETYVDGTIRKWAAIWEKSDGNEHFRYDKKMCDWINTYHNIYKPDGYELIDLEKY
ncbi:MAG: beta-lactamase family protein [Saprospiraceae bacterium]|nr:beta-lactamase family protein [Saprospiraceae bacterium]